MPTIFDTHLPLIELDKMALDHITSNLEERPVDRILDFMSRYLGWGPILDYILDKVTPGDSLVKFDNIVCIYPQGNAASSILYDLVMSAGADAVIKAVVEIQRMDEKVQKGS